MQSSHTDQPFAIRAIVNHPDKHVDALNKSIGIKYRVDEVRTILATQAPEKMNDFDTFIAGCDYLEEIIKRAIAANLPVYSGTILCAGESRFQIGMIQYERTEKFFIARFFLHEL